MKLKHSIKIAAYTLAKALGLFHASRWIMRRRLLILGYHGFQLRDEAAFRPILFMRAEVFAQRLHTIQRNGFRVLPLGQALERLRTGILPDNTVVITIDDGFYSVLAIAAPMLAARNMPSTLYVTSYYMQKGAPIFRLVIQYMFWKTNKTTFAVSDRPWSPGTPIDLHDRVGADAMVSKLIAYGESMLDEPGRQAMLCEIAGMLEVDIEDIIHSRMLSLLGATELERLSQTQMAVQLHTHRHRFPPEDANTCARELADNAASLSPLVAHPSGEHALTHFCYPSGMWDRRHWPVLMDAGVETASTCEPGMNTSSTPLLGLYRVLDQDTLSDVEFEAELFGFCELMRELSGRRKRTDAARTPLRESPLPQ